MTLRLALVAGPMYDHLYQVLAGHDVDIVVRADHPTLNARVAELLAAGERLDLISTHSKYAPSQHRWLRPLGHLVEESALAALAPGAVDLCRHDGALLCAPRLVDVRVLWVRTDRVADVPDGWAELQDADIVFGFTGRESGLFGLFFELVVGAGGRLFDDDVRAVVDSPPAIDAVTTIGRLAARCPPDLADWHYDDVASALLGGRVDAAAAWPGGWGAISRSPLAGVLAPFPYPAGSVRRVSYSGCHAWAIPTTCGDVDASCALLAELLGATAQRVDAAGGNMVANLDALASIEPVDDIDRRRLEITRATIAESMITYPPLDYFPVIEDAGWRAINRVIQGSLTAVDAVRHIQQVAEHCASLPDAP